MSLFTDNLEREVQTLKRRIEKVEDAHDRRLDGQDQKITKLEENIRALDSKVGSLVTTQAEGFKQVNNNFKELTVSFQEEIDRTRAHVDENVNKAINQLENADRRWADTNCKLQRGMDELLTRVTTVEQKPMVEAYRQKQELGKRVWDIIWKILLGLVVAGLAAKGFNIF